MSIEGAIREWAGFGVQITPMLPRILRQTARLRGSLYAVVIAAR